MTEDKDKADSVFIDNSISIGDNNTIKNSSIGNNGPEKPAKKKMALSKIIWSIIVPICVGVAVAAISLWLGLK